MSRIGKKPINIPEGVEVKIDGEYIKVKGPKGELQEKNHPSVNIIIEEKEVRVELTKAYARENAMWGLYGSLIQNMVQGVTEGFKKQLEINGVGYKVNMKGNVLVVDAGYSHPVEYKPEEGITITTEGNVVTVEGINKQRVGSVAAEIRSIRKPEPYKGKGIKYVDEVIRRKAGKVAKGAA